jgi:thiol-disulfide isomerase/thioredoxin
MPDRTPRRTRLLAALGTIVFVAAACTSGGGPGVTQGSTGVPTPPPTGAPTGAPTDAPPPGVTGAPAPSTGGVPELPAAWAQVPLVNVRDGTTFHVADFAGRTIFLENMAIWCGNCKEQQRQATKAVGQLGDDVVFIVLDVEPSEDGAALAAYAEQNGFPFVYAVAPVAYSRAIAAEFGDLVLAPPTTPVWVIGRDGTVTLTPSGLKSAEELIALARR